MVFPVYYVRDNVYNAGQYRENKPRQGEQGEQDLLHPEGAYFR